MSTSTIHINKKISPTSLDTFDVSANLKIHLIKHQCIINPSNTFGSISYNGIINVPVIVASASNNIDNINIALSDVTPIGCNWTTSEISDRIDFIIYSTD